MTTIHVGFYTAAISHGDMGYLIAHLQHFHDIVSETIDHIADRKRAGKTLEEIQGEGLPEKYAPYTGFMPHTVWIGAVYASLDD